MGELLDADPEDNHLELCLAEAAVSVMRIKSHANSLTCDFDSNEPVVYKQDTEANKKLWAEWAPVALDYLSSVQARIGEEVFCTNASSFCLRLEATMYASSSRGIISTTLSGKAVSFLASVRKLESMHTGFDGHVHCVYWGAFYLAAPWPVGSTGTACQYLESLVKAQPASKRNQYWAGVGAFMAGDVQAARSYMENSLMEECASDSERDICEFLTVQARRTLDILSSREVPAHQAAC